MPSRKALHAAAKSTPLEAILGAQVTKALTPRQRKFAKGVAEGKTKVDAYREAYPGATSPNTLSREPYIAARDPRILKEVEAYTLAIESAKQRTPAALRELVIHGLVQVALNPDTKDAVKVQALKTLGTVTEVAAFTERKEVRTISSSEDARRQVMQEIQRLMGANADTVEDAKVIGEADELLRELAGPHPTGTPPVAEPESPSDTHTIPHESSPIRGNSDSASTPHKVSPIGGNSADAKVITPGSENFSEKVITPPPQSGETPR